MSQQPDLREDGDKGSEAGVERVDEEKAEPPGGASPPPGAGPEDREVGGWSGRAIGPLSGLLPGGAVDLTADELPVPPSAVAAEAEAEADDRAAADGAAADDREPAAVTAADDAQPTGVAQATAPPESSQADTGDRWHRVLVDFVNDPRGSVEAASALIDEDITVHIELLARRREAMHATWRANKDADTEALRVALVHYRDLRDRLADVTGGLAG